ncbi:unnamed protein product [Adineta ricciae]|uniref:F-box domain-containing protein n=1 Tax=Adineta ricciae TaxID=249248 RepID=A0A816G3H5_ADIRI|nr:unnamed protein product [Adineta ricciae]
MFATLPIETIECIFLQVNPTDLFSLRAVCWKWYEFITNKHFLAKYFDNRFEQQAKQFALNWVVYHTSPTSLYGLPSIRDYDIQYPVPTRLQGGGDVVLDSMHLSMAVLPKLTYSLYDQEYSISMWLYLESNFERVSFNIKLNGFLFNLTLSKQNCQLCSPHTGIFQTQTQTKIPICTWFYTILTYSSEFQLYINGIHHSFVNIQRSLIENELSMYMVYLIDNGYVCLSYAQAPKFLSVARFADIQILPCALSIYEIRAIINQKRSMKRLNMAKYLINNWNEAHRRFNSFSNCILI